MESSIQHRCYQHADREAVVRCPVCRHFFCRECVTEHDDRMLCRGCLLQLTDRKKTGAGNRMLLLTISLQGAIGFLLLWCIFFWIGRLLLAIPSSFHEGAIWETGWWTSL